MKTILCPSEQQVTREDCEQCGQCRPSPWKSKMKGKFYYEEKLLLVSYL